MYFDIAVIAIVVIFGLIGLWKGFFKTLIGFFGNLACLVIAILLANVVAQALLGIPEVAQFAFGEPTSIATVVGKLMPEAFGTVTIGGATDKITGVLGDSYLKPFADSVMTYINNLNEADFPSDWTLTMCLSRLLANYVFVFMVGLALFLVLRILITFLTMFLKSLIDKDKKIKGINRLMGFFLGLVQGAALVCVSFVVMSVFSGFAFMSPVYEQLDSSKVAKPVSGIVVEMTDKYLNKSEDLLKGFLKDLIGNEQTPDAPDYEMTTQEKNLYDLIDETTSPFEVALDREQELHKDSQVGAKITEFYQLFDQIRLKLNSSGAPENTDFSAIEADVTTLKEPSVLSDIESYFTAFNDAMTDYNTALTTYNNAVDEGALDQTGLDNLKVTLNIDNLEAAADNARQDLIDEIDTLISQMTTTFGDFLPAPANP